MLAQQELVMYTEKMTKQTQQISDYEYEISLLRKQLEALETEREKDRKKIAELEELLAKAREVFPPVYYSVASVVFKVIKKVGLISREILEFETGSYVLLNSPGKWGDDCGVTAYRLGHRVDQSRVTAHRQGTRYSKSLKGRSATNSL